jgi:AraC-like DNA-binding protein
VGRQAGELRGKLLAATDPETRLIALEEALRSRLAKSSVVAHPLAAVATARLSSAPERGVAELGAHLGWSVRRLEQVFRADVGLTPNSYRRLQRFRAALVDVEQAADIGWSACALGHGYYDQAHLVRDFRAHSGFSPTADQRLGHRQDPGPHDLPIATHARAEDNRWLHPAITRKLHRDPVTGHSDIRT